MNQLNLKSFAVFGIAMSILLVLPGSAIAAKGGVPGPPPGGETPNNLSLPAVLTGAAVSTPHSWNPPSEPVLGTHYSYGCDLKEMNGSFSYPNTSCVDSLDEPTVYYDPVGCIEPGAPCAGFLEEEVYRIYWQKEPDNQWSADAEGALAPRSVDYVDWGDALEAVSWSERSVIRVETQPYHSTIEGFEPTEQYCALAAGVSAEDDCKVGHQMWHVSGQGITEHWGVRATDPDPLLEEVSISFNYDSPFQIIHTSDARLNFAKLVPETATCPEPGGNANDPPPDVSYLWDGGWTGACEVFDAPYTVELSVGGKYVFGYNLRMGDIETDLICPGYEKTGYYRLTFYAPDDVIFDDDLAPNVAPPFVPSVDRVLPRDGNFNTVLAPPPPVPEPEAPIILSEDEDPTADDRLFIPVIDVPNNLTYLDICIVAKSQGGGGGGGGGGGKPKK